MLKIFVFIGILMIGDISANKFNIKKSLLALHKKLDSLVDEPSWSNSLQKKIKIKHFCPNCTSDTDAVNFSIERNKYFYPGKGVTGKNTVFVADLIVNEYVKVLGTGELKWVS